MTHHEAMFVLYGMIWQMSYEEQASLFGSSFRPMSEIVTRYISGERVSPADFARLRRIIRQAKERGFDDKIIEVLHTA